MKMIRTSISTLALTYFLLACGQTPTPNNQSTPEQKILGTTQLMVSDGIRPSDLPTITPKGAINESGVQFSRLVSSGATDSATKRYVWATYEFKNITTGNLTNLSLYAYNDSANNAAGTAFKAVRRLDNTAITDTNVIRGIQPSAGLILNAGVFNVNPAEADFQVFRSSEAATVENGAKVLGSLQLNDSILEYGFTVRSASGDRTLVPNELGVVTLGFRVPLQTIVTDTPRRFSTSFTYATDAVTRVTRDKSETTAQVVARAAAPVSATEAVLVGTDSDLATPLATIRLLGFSTYTVPNQPVATIDATGGYAKLGRFIADVPSGALNSATTFTLTKPAAIPAAIPSTDEFLLSQVPGAQVVSLYKITSSVTQYQNPIQIVIPIDIPFSGAVNDYVTELYRWDGSSYTTLRIDKGATNFLYEPIRLAAGGDTFVAVRAPISAEMASSALEAHQKGRVRAALVRGSNFFGPEDEVMANLLFKPALQGKPMNLLGRLDQPHTFTYAPDFGRALAIIGTLNTKLEPQVFGRAWHVPSPEAVTQNQLVKLIEAELGRKVKIQVAGAFILNLLGLFNPIMREAVEMLYEWNQPFIMDSSDFQKTFDVKPTSFEVAIKETLAWNRQQIFSSAQLAHT